MKIKTAFEIHSKELMTKWYPYWCREISEKIPGDFKITDKEIYSEITHQCLYLSDKFKGGSYPAYCNKFVVIRCVNSFWNEYKKIDHSIIFDEEDDEEDEDEYTEKHVIISSDISAKSTLNERHKKTEMMTAVYDAAIKLDKETEGYYQYAAIIDDMRMGMSMEEIAKELGTHKMEISRRFATIKTHTNKENYEA